MRKWKMFVGACALLAGFACKNENNNYNPPGITGPTGPSGALVTGIVGLPDTLHLWLGGGGSCGPAGALLRFSVTPAGADSTIDVTSSNTNAVDVGATVPNSGAIRVNGENVGSATVTVTSRSNPSVVKTIVVTVSLCSSNQNIPVVVSPATGSGNPGQTLQLTATQNGVNVTSSCVWSFSSQNIVTVSSSGLLTFSTPGSTSATCTVSNGSGSGTYTTNQPSTQAVLTNVLPSGATYPLNCSNGAGSVVVPFTAYDQFGNLITSGVVWSVVSGPGQVAFGSNGGTFTVAGSYQISATYNGKMVTVPVTITGTCSQNSTFTSVTPNNVTLNLVCNNGTGSVQATFQALDQNGAVMQNATVALQSGPQGGVSLSGMQATFTQAGTYTFNVTVGGVTKTATVTIAGSCTGQFITIRPKTFGTLVVGGASQQDTVSASGPYTATSSSPCAAVSQSGNIVTITAVNCAAYQQNGTQSVVITATLNGTSLSDQSSGTVTSGIVTCTATINGVQVKADTTFTLPKGQSLQGFANCLNQNGSPFLPLVHSSNTNEVRPTGSAVVLVGNEPWQVGPSFVLTADNSAGTNGPARITIQHSLTDTGTILSFFVNVP